jgi:hypothetical protein
MEVGVVFRTHQDGVDQNCRDDDTVKPLLIYKPNYEKPETGFVVQPLYRGELSKLDLFSVQPEDLALVLESLFLEFY